MTGKNVIWTPDAAMIETANVTALAKCLECADFEALYALSLSEPKRYWDAVNDFTGIRWRRPYVSYTDLSRGREFPIWFPEGRLNWAESILRHAEDGADRMAVVSVTESGATGTATYGELRDMVRCIAGGLRAQGIDKSDCVGLLMENGLDATATFLALSYIGAIVVPLFSGFGSDAIAARLSSCDARFIVVSAGFARRGRFVDTRATIEAVRAGLDGQLKVILRTSEWAPDTIWPDAVDWAHLRQATPLIEAEEMTTDDPFMLIYTSGTTGKPKGTVHTHGGFPIKIAHDAALHFNITGDAVFCWPADMGWIAGALVLTSALIHGATLICYDGAPDYPDWGRLPRLIETYGITHFGSAPTLIRGLAANTPMSIDANMSSIQLLITAGESIAPEHFTWFQENIGPGNTPVINYTGGSEASGALLSSVITRPIPSGVFNAPSPGVAVDIVDRSGRSITGEVGELAVREPFVGMTRGFWRDDERYLETYWRTVPGLWIHGDLAVRDASGNHILVGRSDDTIKVAGKRVGPAEVEGIVVEIAGVEEVAVIGVNDPKKGQVIVVFLTGDAILLGDIETKVSARIGERLGKPFRPAAVHVVDDLPKTRSLKIMRRVIRAVYSGVPAGDLSSLVNPEAIDGIRSAIGQGNEKVGT